MVNNMMNEQKNGENIELERLKEHIGKKEYTFREDSLPKFCYAGFFIRFVAFIIDSLIIKAIQSMVLSPIKVLLYNNGIEFSKFIYVEIIIALLYFTLMTKLCNGATLGKLICGIRVVPIHSKELTWSMVFTREFFGRYIQNYIYILYLVVMFTPKKQSVVDYLSDTVVIKEDTVLFFKEQMGNFKNLSF